MEIIGDDVKFNLMGKVIRLPSAYVINTKTVGVSKNNADGSSRQEIIKSEVSEDDPLRLEHEPDNPYDPHAIKVLTISGHQIGYLSKDVAPKIQSALENEAQIHAKVSWVSGEKMLGVGLRLELIN